MTGARAERSRERIREAAIDLFLEVGYPGTSMDALARRAEVARATIYNNFEDKVEILALIVGDYVSGYVDMIRRLPTDEVRSVEESFGLIRTFILEALRWRAANAYLRPLIEQAKHLREAGWEQMDTYADAVIIDWLLTIHRADAERDLIRSEIDLVFATGAVHSMIDRTLTVTDRSLDDGYLENLADRLADLYWHAIYLVPPPTSAEGDR
jgi:AcrR family transcriptional regulator